MLRVVVQYISPRVLGEDEGSSYSYRFSGRCGIAVVLLLTSLCIAGVLNSQGPPRDGNDPPPTLRPPQEPRSPSFPGRASSQGTPRDGNDPPAALRPPHDSLSRFYPSNAGSAPGRLLLSRKLTGYRKGDPLNAESFAFLGQIASDLERLVANKSGSLRVVITGTTDGIPNRGLQYPLHRLASECQRAVTGPISDPVLAYLRACVARHQLSTLVQSSAIDIIWEGRIRDEPDGFNVGNPYRSIQVEVFQ